MSRYTPEQWRRLSEHTDAICDRVMSELDATAELDRPIRDQARSANRMIATVILGGVAIIGAIAWWAYSHAHAVVGASTGGLAMVTYATGGGGGSDPVSKLSTAGGVIYLIIVTVNGIHIVWLNRHRGRDAARRACQRFVRDTDHGR